MRFLRRHANALSFWGVLVLVALALVVATALFRGPWRQGEPGRPQSVGSSR